MSKKYLPFYLTEFAYKYNRRNEQPQAFEETIEKSVSDDKCLVKYKPKKNVECITYGNKCRKKHTKKPKHKKRNIKKGKAKTKVIAKKNTKIKSVKKTIKKKSPKKQNNKKAVKSKNKRKKRSR